jgi:deazaflavin-dependent oxidoreductase (nitroreductase family)
MAGPRLRRLRGLATHVANPFIRPFAAYLPWFGVLTHVGRRSGRAYRTPLNVFRDGDTMWFALTYGADVDWVRNVLAAGGATLRTRGSDLRLVEPEIVVDPELAPLPWLPRTVERLNRVTELLRMRVIEARGQRSG